jgi:hypothetical protein
MELTLKDLYQHNVNQVDSLSYYIMDLTGCDKEDANEAAHELLDQLEDLLD